MGHKHSTEDGKSGRRLRDRIRHSFTGNNAEQTADGDAASETGSWRNRFRKNENAGASGDTTAGGSELPSSTASGLPPPAPSSIQSGPDPTLAAKSIQDAWKGHQAAEDDENWKIFNDLENKEEADVLQLSSFLSALNAYMPAETSGFSDLVGSPSSVDNEKENERCLKSQLSGQSLSHIDITGLIEKVRLDPILTLQNVLDMIESFKQDRILDRKYVFQIIRCAQDLLEGEPNIKEVEIAPAPHITIVGDLHGQLDDLLLILNENGLPSEQNPYVFNGDFVDRGPKSIEIMLILYGFYILYPKHVHLNRGNHEERSISTIFGFLKECQEKYDTRTYDVFMDSFRWLPIGTVINKRILVIHGGLTKYDVSVKEMALLPRWNFTLPREPTSCGIETPCEKMKEEQANIMREILWSDPCRYDGLKENNRGAGVLFGPNITERFLLKNNLQLIVRSHECVPQGFHWPYGPQGMLVTLFSASNYGGKANNLGAFMRIPADEATYPSFFQYVATKQKKDMFISNLDSLISIIIEHNEELLQGFRDADPEKRGYCSLFIWVKVMEETLKLHLNWRTLQPLLTVLDEHGCIPYEDFLDRYHVSATKDDAETALDKTKRKERRQLFNSLYKHRARLEALFRSFDADGNGVISMNEFKIGLKILNGHLPEGVKPFDNAEELMHLVDMRNDSSLDINEFMELFRINARLTRRAKWRRARNKIKAFTAFGRALKARIIASPKPLGPGDRQGSVLCPTEDHDFTSGTLQDGVKFTSLDSGEFHSCDEADENETKE